MNSLRILKDSLCRAAPDGANADFINVAVNVMDAYSNDVFHFIADKAGLPGNNISYVTTILQKFNNFSFRAQGEYIRELEDDQTLKSEPDENIEIPTTFLDSDTGDKDECPPGLASQINSVNEVSLEDTVIYLRFIRTFDLPVRFADEVYARKLLISMSSWTEEQLKQACLLSTKIAKRQQPGMLGSLLQKVVPEWMAYPEPSTCETILLELRAVLGADTNFELRDLTYKIATTLHNLGMTVNDLANTDARTLKSVLELVTKASTDSEKRALVACMAKQRYLENPQDAALPDGIEIRTMSKRAIDTLIKDLAKGNRKTIIAVPYSEARQLLFKDALNSFKTTTNSTQLPQVEVPSLADPNEKSRVYVPVVRKFSDEGGKSVFKMASRDAESLRVMRAWIVSPVLMNLATKQILTPAEMYDSQQQISNILPAVYKLDGTPIEIQGLGNALRYTFDADLDRVNITVMYENLVNADGSPYIEGEVLIQALSASKLDGALNLVQKRQILL